MEITEIQSLVSDFDKLHKKIISEKTSIDHDVISKQFNTTDHDVYSKSLRPDKPINTDAGPSTSAVTRIGIPMQKKIVGLSATFLCGIPIKIDASVTDEGQKGILAVISKSWEDNKLDYDSLSLAKLLMSETEVAELWYTEPVDPDYWAGTVNEGSKFRLRMKIIANSQGDKLYPVFNSFGDMIAFGRGYFVRSNGATIEHFDLYTDKNYYKATKTNEGWSVTSEVNLIGKIPVIYYWQKDPEWKDVQSMIDRLEKLLSNHGDSNDYFGSPMIIVKGEVKGFSKKGEQGKVLELEGGAEASYLTWDQAPESVKLEYQNLRSLIHDMTDTPDISFESMKGMGTFSGIALRMLFLGAHMKAAEKEAIFGKGIQRRLNYIKAAMAKINIKLEPATKLSIKPKFEYYLPQNLQEMVDILVSATGGNPIMSKKTAVAHNPLVVDPEEELARIKEEGLDSQMV